MQHFVFAGKIIHYCKRPIQYVNLFLEWCCHVIRHLSYFSVLCDLMPKILLVVWRLSITVILLELGEFDTLYIFVKSPIEEVERLAPI